LVEQSIPEALTVFKGSTHFEKGMQGLTICHGQLLDFTITQLRRLPTPAIAGGKLGLTRTSIPVRQINVARGLFEKPAPPLGAGINPDQRGSLGNLTTSPDSAARVRSRRRDQVAPRPIIDPTCRAVGLTLPPVNAPLMGRSPLMSRRAPC